MQSSQPGEDLGLWRFIAAIDWQEPWLMGLLTFHVVVTATAVGTRNRGNLQAFLFFTLLLLVYFSEWINELAATHWRYFSRYQYFDSKGMFISLVFSIPLLINCLVMVCNWMWMSGTLMVKLKQAQLRGQIRSTTRQDSDVRLKSTSKLTEKVKPE